MMSALNMIFKKAFWNDVTRVIITSCPSGCARFYSKKHQPGDVEKHNSPLKNLLDNAATYDDLHPKDPNNVWATHPYPAVLRNEIELESGTDPGDVSIILFPGQGTQFVGMGKDLVKFPQAKDLYDIASEVIGVDLLNIVTQEDLKKYSQELIVVSSLAALEKLREERPSALTSCVATAGFSLGEITALIFAGAIPLEQGLKLVSIRSAAMEAASKENPGGMLSVIYGADTNIKQVCAKAVAHCTENGLENAFCSIANYLYPQCKVLSGCEMALKFIETNARELGIRRARRLNVSGAFHSVAVRAAVAPVKEALRLCDISEPQIRVMSGVDGMHYRNVGHIMAQLPKQIVRAVRWEQLLHNLYARPPGHSFPRTFEVGPGHTLRTILRQVNAKAWDNSFSITA